MAAVDIVLSLPPSVLPAVGLRFPTDSSGRLLPWCHGKHAQHCSRLAPPLSILQPGLAGVVSDPPAHGLGLCTAASIGGIAAAAAVQEARAACLRDRVRALCSPQIRSVDPEGRIFSLYNLGEYEACLSVLKSILAFEPVISRPVPKVPLNSDGQRVVNPSKFVMPVESRPVQVLDDRLEHWRQALTCQVRPQGSYSLPPACVKAIDHMLGLGHQLPAWRAKQVRTLRGVSKRASRLTRTLKASWALGAAAQRLEQDVRKVNVVLLMLLCDALEHPGVDLRGRISRVFPSQACCRTVMCFGRSQRRTPRSSPGLAITTPCALMINGQRSLRQRWPTRPGLPLASASHCFSNHGSLRRPTLDRTFAANQ